MSNERIQVLIRLGLVTGIDSAHALHNVSWLLALDQDEADEVFMTEIGSLVWSD